MKRKSIRQPVILCITSLLLGSALFFWCGRQLRELKIESDAYLIGYLSTDDLVSSEVITEEKAEQVKMSNLGGYNRSEKKISTYKTVRIAGTIVFGVSAMFFGAVAYLEQRKTHNNN